MMNKKFVFLILAVALVGILVAAGVMYDKLGSEMAPDQLAVQTQPTAKPTEPAETTHPTEIPKATEAPATTEATEPTYMTAPDFTVYDREGNPHKLSDFFGKPIVLNFWASWCSPCKMEMPDFNEKHLEIGEEVQFLMINLTDGYRETVEVAAEFIESQGYRFPVFFDTAYEASNTYGVSSIPTTYFLNAEGKLIAKATGAIDAATLQRGIDMVS